MPCSSDPAGDFRFYKIDSIIYLRKSALFSAKICEKNHAPGHHTHQVCQKIIDVICPPRDEILYPLGRQGQENSRQQAPQETSAITDPYQNREG